MVNAFCSGAAVRGSPLPGGDAGAKATLGFIASCASAKSGRGGPGPALTPELAGQAITGLGHRPGHGQDACLLTAAGPAPLT